MPDALAVHDLRKRYGANEALKGVELDGRRGRAGRAARAQRRGQVDAREDRLRARAADERERSRSAATIGYLAELFRFPDWLSADELLQLHQKLAGSDGGARRARRAARAGRPGGGRDAAGRRDVEGHAAAARDRAGDDRRRRGCCCSTSRRARSTPPAGGRCASCWRRCASRGVAVLLNSHLLSEVELVCDRVAIIARGEVVAAGTPAELSRAGGVEVETGRGVAAVRAGARARTSPRIVRELVEAGEEVYGVRVLRSSLEDAYLEVVGGR